MRSSAFHLSRVLALSSAVSLVVAGCVGSMDAGDREHKSGDGVPPVASTGRGGTNGGVMDGPGTTTGPGGSGGTGSTAAAACAPAPTRIWRISAEQFANAVADLLPGVKIEKPISVGSSEDAFLNSDEAPAVGGSLAGAYQRSARDAAEQASAAVATLVPCGPAEDRTECLRRFVDRFAPRAFRRPLAPVEREGLLAVYTTSAKLGHGAGVAAVVEAVLQSPSFLYRTELGAGGAPGKIVSLTPHEIASGLAFFLLDSVPDEELWRAASDGSLTRREVVDAQVRRLLTLPRVRAHATSILLRWIGAPAVLRVERDSTKFPELDGALRQSLLAEVQRFVDDRLWNGGTVADLMTSRRTFLDARLAKLYGTTAPAGTSWAERDLPSGQRGGLITLAGFIASMPPGDRVVHRGKALRFGLLCGTVPAPPPEIDTAPPAGQKLTERQFAAARAANPACGGCHAFMDPLGLALESYDDIGRFLTSRDGRPVDASGTLQQTDVDGPFKDALELSERLGRSAVLRSCLVERLITFAVGRGLGDEYRCEHQRVLQTFETGGAKLADAIAAVAGASLFSQRRVQE